MDVIEDILVRPEKAASYALVSTGGYLGIAKNDVATLANEIKIKGNPKDMNMANKKIFFAFLLAFMLAASVGLATANAESPGEYVDDSIVTAKVKVALMQEISLKSLEINVETHKGVVQLSGFVSTQANIDLAVKVALTIAGVQSVKNDMHLK